MFVVRGPLEALHRSQTCGYRCRRTSRIFHLYSVLFWSLPEISNALVQLSFWELSRSSHPPESVALLGPVVPGLHLSSDPVLWEERQPRHSCENNR